MSDQLLSTLKNKLDELISQGTGDAETLRNVIKEELQYYVLNFIYHHSEHSHWIMYGGSCLRICHGLNRMSVDLDFEIDHPCTGVFLVNLKNEIEKHFQNAYALSSNLLSIKLVNGRGLLLKFLIGETLTMQQHSKQVHIKIDLNYFAAPKTVIEHIPITHNQFSFVIKTYNMSALMASKIAALFLRGKRGIGKEIYNEKGRDIYDLLWYMGKHIIPDLDYLQAKAPEITDLRTLFDRLTIKMNDVSDQNLKQDLSPLFLDQAFIQNWLDQWRESYLRLVTSYEIHTITAFREVRVTQDFRSDVFYFNFWYETNEKKSVHIEYTLSDDWVKDVQLNLPASIELIDDRRIQFAFSAIPGPNIKQKEQLKKYGTLFYQKNEAYFKKTHRVVLGDTIATKMIRMTAAHFKQKEQAVINKSALLSCELEDLLK